MVMEPSLSLGCAVLIRGVFIAAHAKLAPAAAPWPCACSLFSRLPESATVLRKASTLLQRHEIFKIPRAYPALQLRPDAMQEQVEALHGSCAGRQPLIRAQLLPPAALAGILVNPQGTPGGLPALMPPTVLQLSCGLLRLALDLHPADGAGRAQQQVAELAVSSLQVRTTGAAHPVPM